MAIRHLQEKYSKYRTGPSTTTSNMQTVHIPPDMESPVPVMGGLLMAITAVAAATDAVPSIPHKNVRPNDNESVVAANSGSIVVLSRGAREECYIPNIHVEGYMGMTYS
jgi:hypothetical protein